MRFERTDDTSLLHRIITTPEVYRDITDDGSPAAGDYQPIVGPAIWNVLVYASPVGDNAETLMGMFVFHPENSITWQVHTCLLPCAWGRSVEFARGVVGWIFATTDCLRIVTHVPEGNRLALRLAQKAGLVEYGRNLRSYLKHGKLWDEILLGVSKPVAVVCKEVA